MGPRWVSLLLVCLLAPAALLAEDYYLPQVANGSYGGGSFRTTFVFFNTNNTAVTVRLELTGDSGGPLSLTIPGLGTDDEFTFQLAAGATRILQTDGSGSLVAGAARVNASARIGVSAVFTVYNSSGNFQTEAGVGGAEGLTDLVIPVDVTGSFNTAVALYNIGTSSASVTLRLVNTSGVETGQAPLSLVGRGHTAQFVTQLFPGTSNFRGTLRVSSSVPIAAVGLRQNDPPLSYTSLPAVSRSSTKTEFNLPQVANGSFGSGSFKTSFLIFNISGSAANVSLTLTQDNGSPFPVTIPGQGTNSTFSIPLAAGASSFLQTDGAGSLAAGAARITSNVPLGAAAIFTVLDAQGRFQTESGVGDSAVQTSLTLPVDVTGSFDTAVAFFVPGTAPVVLNLKLLDSNGAIAATAQPLTLLPKNHTAQFVTQLFPGTSNFRGSLAITAPGGVAALTLRQHSGPLSYTTLPVAAGAAAGTQPQVGPLLSKNRTGIAATSDSTLDETLPSGYRLSGTISGTLFASTVYAKSGTTEYVGAVNLLTGRYLVVVPAGTYNLVVCHQPELLGGVGYLISTFRDPTAVQVSSDTERNIAVPPATLYNVSGTVSGLPSAPPGAERFVAFSSSTNDHGGAFGIDAAGQYQGRLPSGSYVASLAVFTLGSTGSAISSIYNIGSATVSSAPVTANLTVPATAQLSGSARIAGTPVTTANSFFVALDKTAPAIQDLICASLPAFAQSALDAAGAYSVRLATNRAHSINVAIPVLRTATTVLAGEAIFPVTERTVTLGADGTADFNLPAFPSQVRITGKVTDSTGKGVKDVTVTAYSKELSGAADLGYSGSAQTDVNGAYELVLLRGINYEVTFTPQPPTP